MEQARAPGRRPSAPVDEPARDEQLVRRAKGGDAAAFDELVVVYQDFLFRLVVRTVGDREAAADAVQEAFLNAYRNLGAFRGGSFRGWLARIALNAATDILRGRKRRPSEPYPDWADEDWQPTADEDADPEREATRRARGRALAGALAAIGEDQRRAIVLYDVEGFDYGEIAEITGVSLGTVKSRIHRGRLALRELLVEHLELFHD
ncbi:MAG TPA: sigma-70 family RNA polymerase sigma factor [Candidatus Limnocylindrales bacterium]|nr:sigma-70 family RNA polymerase sigma factor [Candidatus Limnocylindrales bacterium]